MPRQTKQTKLDTLKFLVIKWDHNRGIPDAWAVCEYLKDNLNIDESEFTKDEQ